MSEINKFQICCCCECKNKLIPSYFNNFFTVNYRIHSQNTTNKNKLHKPYCRTSSFIKLIKFVLKFIFTKFNQRYKCAKVHWEHSNMQWFYQTFHEN